VADGSEPSDDPDFEFGNPWLGRTQNFVSGWIMIDTANGHPGGQNEFFNGGSVQFTTDHAGNFLSWNFGFIGDPEALDIASRGDFRLYLGCTDVSGDQLCARSSSSGTWTMRKVPESGSLAMALAGLAGVLLVRRKAVCQVRAASSRFKAVSMSSFAQ
jgi:hypothetical protein